MTHTTLFGRTHRRLTRDDAQVFFDLPDKSRTAILRRLTPDERELALAALVSALSR